MTNSSTDTGFVIQHSAFKGYQVLSLITPPIYILSTLYRGRHRFELNRMLRATWVGGLAGTAVGGSLGWARLRTQSPESIQDRRIRLMHNVTQIRADDYSTIGSILFAVLTPAFFWRRAQTANLILGGAGLGSATGILVHLSRSASEGHDLKPVGMADALKNN